MAERHTQQGQDMRQRLIGSRRPFPETSRPEPDHKWAYRQHHDYTWRGVPAPVPVPQAPKKPAPKPRRRKRPAAARPEPVTPIYPVSDPVIPAHVVTHDRRTHCAVTHCDTVSERPIRRDYSVATMLDDLITSEPVSIYRFPETRTG